MNDRHTTPSPLQVVDNYKEIYSFGVCSISLLSD